MSTRLTAKEIQDLVRSHGGCVPGAKLPRDIWPLDPAGNPYESLRDMAAACGLFVSERSGTTTHINVAISPEALAAGPSKSTTQYCKHAAACTHILKSTGCRNIHSQTEIDAARASRMAAALALAAAGGGGPAPAAEPEKINGRIRCRDGAKCKGPCTWGHTSAEIKAQKAAARAPASGGGAPASDADDLRRVMQENERLKTENMLIQMALRVSMSALPNPATLPSPPRGGGGGGGGYGRKK